MGRERRTGYLSSLGVTLVHWPSLSPEVYSKRSSLLQPTSFPAPESVESGFLFHRGNEQVRIKCVEIYPAVSTCLPMSVPISTLPGFTVGQSSQTTLVPWKTLSPLPTQVTASLTCCLPLPFLHLFFSFMWLVTEVQGRAQGFIHARCSFKPPLDRYYTSLFLILQN